MQSISENMGMTKFILTDAATFDSKRVPGYENGKSDNRRVGGGNVTAAEIGDALLEVSNTSFVAHPDQKELILNVVEKDKNRRHQRKLTNMERRKRFLYHYYDIKTRDDDYVVATRVLRKEMSQLCHTYLGKPLG
jgi:hypothetical protein